jgi:hypothetical protein
VSVATFAKGLYSVKIKNNSSIYTKKLMIQ